MTNIPSKILIVDDEPYIRQVLKMYLSKEGFLVEEVSNGQTALQLALNNHYQFIVLDIMLPGLNGLDICKQIRMEKETPILILSAKASEHDKLDCFRAGADDYVTKPFSPREIVHRIQGILSRYSKEAYQLRRSPSSSRVIYRDLVIEPEARSVSIGKKKISLTMKEYDLLMLLVSNRGTSFSLEQLYNQIWQETSSGDFRTVVTHIKRLREKLNHAQSFAGDMIQTVWGIGYMINDCNHL